MTVSRVEVNQAIQTETNSIELVGGRSTAVRAFVNVTGDRVEEALDITGRLHVFVNGSEVTPVAGVEPINDPFDPPAAPLRPNENHSLNFELPAPTAIGTSTNVDFRVDLTPLPNEDNAANNTGFANDLTSRNRAAPRLFFTRVNYTPKGLGLPPIALARPGTGDAFTCGILPVNDADPNFYRRSPVPTMTFSNDDNGDGLLNGNDDSELMSALASQRQLIVEDGLGANDLTYLYGWLAGAVPGNGLGQLPGHNAFGNGDPVRAQRTFTHELTHNLGLDHINRTLDPDTGWDFDQALNLNPATNNTLGRAKPPPRNDVQVPGQLTNSAWVDEENYRFLLDHPSFAPEPTLLDRLRALAKRQFLVIEGQIDPSGGRLLSLEPAFRYPWKSQATPLPAGPGAPYRAIVKTTSGKTMTVPFSAKVGNDEELVHRSQGYFEVMIPVDGTVEEIAIGRRVGGRTKMLGSRKRSRTPPRLETLKPGQGARVSARTTLDWRASDADTKPSRLQFQVAYSPDGGKSFVPAGTDLKRSKLTVDPEQLPKSNNGIFRIFVSDGLNSRFKDIRNVRIVGQIFLPAPTACQDPLG